MVERKSVIQVALPSLKVDFTTQIQRWLLATI